VLDDERCILCTRCIRFTKDIVGDDALGIVNRGSFNVLTAYPGRQFDNNYTLNTVDICPVGALTSKDFRFQMRVWFLKETKSICTSCATGCNIVIGSREEKLYLLAKLSGKLGALTDSVPRTGEGDKLLLNTDRNPNGTGARLTGIASNPMGSNLPKIAEAISKGTIKSVLVFGEDVTKRGI